jgi:hypothetical protein
MSSSPPTQPGRPTPPDWPDKGLAFTDMRRRKWWELLLMFLPVPMGLFGLPYLALGIVFFVFNVWVARQPLSPIPKLLFMLGVVVASYVAFLILVPVLSGPTRSS